LLIGWGKLPAMSLVRNFTIVGSATLASRITGFVRDLLVASTLGASAVADAYVAAFLLPNFFRRLIGEGAFNAAFVPIFTRRQTDEGRESAVAFAESALSLFLGLALIITILAHLFMPGMISIVAPGFSPGTPRFTDAVAFGQILYPFIAIILLVAVFTGLLNALSRYAVAAWAPVLLNIIVIGVLIHAQITGLKGTQAAGFSLSIAIVAAGLLNLAIVAWKSHRLGYGLLPRWHGFDADVKRLLLIAIPGILIAGAGHLNVVIASQMSSGTPSAVSWLYFAERIFQLPLGFVAAAVGVVLLPAMSRSLMEGNLAEARAAEARALEFGLLVAIPAAIALVFLARPIVSILFVRGAFSAEDGQAVAQILRLLAIGLPAFVLVKVFLPAFLARENLRVPMLAAAAGIAANLILSVLLKERLAHAAPAAGVAASAIVNALILYGALVASGRMRPDRLSRQRLPKVLLICVITGAAIFALGETARPWLRDHVPSGGRILTLGGVCTAVIALHLALCHLFGMFRVQDMRDLAKARKATESAGKAS
jgi:putative peptidoglycan lipid II flippase